MAVNKKIVLLISTLVAVVFFVAGILVGHFSIEKSNSTTDNGKSGAFSTDCENDQYTEEEQSYRNEYINQCIVDSCYKAGTCNTFGLPRTYIAYHLNSKTINMDGRLDDEAWQEVPWTEPFVDMHGPEYPKPYFESKVKIRWNDERLYVGAYLQETDFWGTITQDEEQVWKENSFATYIVADGSMHNYKEMQINVLNATWDLNMEKPYIDNDGQCPEGENVADSNWSSEQEKKTYTDGVINDPNQQGTFWSVEWSFTFQALSQYTNRPQSTPDANEAWFMDFFRGQYKVNVEDGVYVKDEEEEVGGWAWQPVYAGNPHFPNRFGLVQFKRDLEDKKFSYDRWHLYKALFEVFSAQKKNRMLNREYSMHLDEIGVSPFVLSQMCADVEVVSASRDDFEATAKSRIDATLPTAHIRADRYVWFTED